MPSFQVMFIGPAGSGKTALTASFGRWLTETLGSTVSYVNLDPGCESTPYEPDFDIRRMFTVEEIMKKEGLGPNGAMIRAMDMLAEEAGEIAGKIASLSSEYKLIDTPGQSEIFVFRDAGPTIARALLEKAPTVVTFLIDPELGSSASSLAAVLSMAIACRLRLGVPVVHVVSKGDLPGSSEAAKMLADPGYLRGRVESEGGGALIDFALEYVDAIEAVSKAQRSVVVSAKTRDGFEKLYSILHEVLCECGDLT